jgi:hypothetical protein
LCSKLSALANKHGCDTDWSCCMKSNKFNCVPPPPCLANCQVSCGVPTPPPTPSTCTTGKSATLAWADYQVWKDLHHDLDAFSWNDCAVLLTDPCSCKFVECGFVQNSSDPNSHILALDLSGANTHGELPPSISQLKFLRSLDLSHKKSPQFPRPSATCPPPPSPTSPAPWQATPLIALKARSPCASDRVGPRAPPAAASAPRPSSCRQSEACGGI